MSRPTVLWDTEVPTRQIHLATAADDMSARNSAIGFDIQNAVDFRPYTVWKAPDAGPQEIIINGIGGSGVSPFTVDAFGIANHNFGTLGLTLSLYWASSTNPLGAWTLATTLSPTDDSAIFHLFTSSSHRYWRLSLDGNGNDIPRMGMFFIGDRTVMVDNFDPGVDPLSETPVYDRPLRNVAGHLVPSAGKAVERAFNFQLEPVGSAKADHAALIDPLWAHVRKARPFFFNYNTDESMFSPLVLRLAQGGIVRPFISGGYRRRGLSFPVANAIAEDL